MITQPQGKRSTRHPGSRRGAGPAVVVFEFDRERARLLVEEQRANPRSAARAGFGQLELRDRIAVALEEELPLAVVDGDVAGPRVHDVEVARRERNLERRQAREAAAGEEPVHAREPGLVSRDLDALAHLPAGGEKRDREARPARALVAPLRHRDARAVGRDRRQTGELLAAVDPDLAGRGRGRRRRRGVVGAGHLDEEQEPEGRSRRARLRIISSRSSNQCDRSTSVASSSSGSDGLWTTTGAARSAPRMGLPSRRVLTNNTSLSRRPLHDQRARRADRVADRAPIRDRPGVVDQAGGEREHARRVAGRAHAQAQEIADAADGVLGRTHRLARGAAPARARLDGDLRVLAIDDLAAHGHRVGVRGLGGGGGAQARLAARAQPTRKGAELVLVPRRRGNRRPLGAAPVGTVVAANE